MGTVSLRWDTSSSRYADPVRFSTGNIYQVAFPHLFKFVKAINELDNFIDGLRIFVVKDSQGRVLLQRDVSTRFTLVEQSSSLFMSVGMVAGEHYQMVMWAINNQGGVLSSYQSMTVTTGGKVAGSELETPSPPPPVGGGGGGGNPTLALQVAQAGTSLNVNVQLSPADVQLVDINVDNLYSGLSIRTDSTGHATGTLNTSSYGVGTHTAKAYLDAFPTIVSSTVNFTIAPSTIGVSSIQLASDKTKITDTDNTVTFTELVKASTGAGVGGASVYVTIDGQTGNTPVSVTDGSGQGGFTLTFANAAINHTISVTAGGVTSNVITVGPSGGGIIGGLGKYGPWLILGAIGLVALSSRGRGGSQVIRV